MMKGKFLAGLFTICVLFLLVTTGPVEGLSLDLQANKIKPERGEKVTFTADVNIDADEVFPIDRITLELDGASSMTCTFDANGTPLDGCTNIKITKLSSDAGVEYGHYEYNYGYGYGFTSGKLSYKIELDTSKMKIGSYSTLLKIKSGDNIMTKQGQTISVKSGSSGSTCTQEWMCEEWSPCVSNVQYRTCYQNLNYCELEPKPDQTRVCLSDDFQETLDLSSMTQTPNRISAPQSHVIQFVSSSWENLKFIIILLLMNSIITLINIIVRVQENRRLIIHRKRQLPKMPTPPKKKLR